MSIRMKVSSCAFINLIVAKTLLFIDHILNKGFYQKLNTQIANEQIDNMNIELKYLNLVRITNHFSSIVCKDIIVTFLSHKNTTAVEAMADSEYVYNSPIVTESEVGEFLKTYYDIEAKTVKRLIGYDSANFHATDVNGKELLFKACVYFHQPISHRKLGINATIPPFSNAILKKGEIV